MREILFRAKRLGIGDWVHGFLQDRKTPFQIELGDGQWYIFVAPENPDDSYVFYQVDPETVGQYTGMKDKAGRRIFEGDIVRAETYHDCGQYGEKGEATYAVTSPGESASASIETASLVLLDGLTKGM